MFSIEIYEIGGLGKAGVAMGYMGVGGFRNCSSTLVH